MEWGVGRGMIAIRPVVEDFIFQRTLFVLPSPIMRVSRLTYGPQCISPGGRKNYIWKVKLFPEHKIDPV